MESDNIHDQMAQYDFKAPLEVTMIFDENEEGALPELSSMKLENINDVEEGNDNSSISESIDANEIMHATNIKLTQISTATVQENSKKMVVNDCSKENRIINADESITENINNSLKRKTDNECTDELDTNTKKLKNNNKENPNNWSNKSNNTESKTNNNEDDMSILDRNNNNKHLNDLDSTTLIQINAKILIELLKTVSEHLLIIIKQHFSFLQFQNDKSIDLYKLDSMKNCYLRLKYHYFDLTYCTVSTILLPQETNAGFIRRFLNHTLQLSKDKDIKCTYKILETLFIEMLNWAKVKKKHLTTFSSNVSNQNIMLKQQLLIPPKKMSFSNSDDLNKGKQIQNTCIFTSGPPGRQVQISVEPSFVHKKNSHGTPVIQENIQLSHKPSSIHQNKQQIINDKSSLAHQISQPLTIEPSSIYDNSQPSMAEPSLTHQNTHEISAEPSIIHQNKQQNMFEPSASIQQNRQHVNPEPSSIQKLIVEPMPLQQNGHLINVESSITNQNSQQINAELSLIHQNRQQNNFKLTNSSTQQNIPYVSPVQPSIHQLNQQQFSNIPSWFQQNRQPINVEPSLTHLNSEQIGSEPSLIHKKNQRKRNKSSASSFEPLPLYQTTPQNTVEQSLFHQNRQPHPSLQSPGTIVQGYQNNIQNDMHSPNHCVNHMNCNFSHYNPQSYANYPTNGRFMQEQHPAVFQNRYPPSNVVPNYGTPPRAGPPPSNYYDAVFRYHQPRYQMRHLSQGYYNHELVIQDPDVLPPNIDTTRSSVSKDSGIMSPLCSETSTDQLSLPLVEDLHPNANVTPMITHVTSLNPNASHIIEGNCIVCQKSTNSKCLGCYKCYYCSHKCQTKDWKSHINICRQSS